MEECLVDDPDRCWPSLQKFFDVDSFVTIAESTAAYVTRARYRDDTEFVVIKSGSLDSRFSVQPHDIGKELRILQSLNHANVIEVLGETYESPTSTLHYWMPSVPYHLSEIFASPHFSPYAAPGCSSPANPSSFLIVTKSLVYQALSALAYIHAQGIAHRDIKPRNLLLTADGWLKVIDFGVAWSEEPNERDLWPEARGKMCFDVATGPYRAPELLFGAADYDGSAIDLWSMGAVFAELFTPLRLRRVYGDEDDEDWYQEDEEDNEGADPESAKVPFIVPKSLSADQRDVEWSRESLYDSTRGQIGLAWSIFKVHGTPTEESWPAFKELPDAQKVTFMQVPPTDLLKLLPNLPAQELEPEREDILDLVKRLLSYPPEQRIRASAAMEHQLFTRCSPLLLPPSYPNNDNRGTVIWEGRELGEVCSLYLGSS